MTQRPVDPKRASSKTRTIKVDYLARVEGEGALYLKIKNDRVTDVKLKIYEPPRFFEAFLRGRRFEEAPDITARICGICPVAYQMSACHAMEQALDIILSPELRQLRRLLYCGEWIESHVLHIYMLHAPDFLGYDSAVAMAKDHRAIVERGLKLKSVGNQIVSVVGGREIHPINVRVGGFYRLPDRDALFALVEPLTWAKAAAAETLAWASTFSFPQFEQEYEYVSLRHTQEYPMNEGAIVSNHGLNVAPHEFETRFIEEQSPHSTALHCRLDGNGAYFVGPMARFNLNFDRLSLEAQQLAMQFGVSAPCHNPFKSILVRAIEVFYACDEALRILHTYRPPRDAHETVTPKASTGYACTEAPRGILYHRYELDDNGTILNAKIVPPTSQNQHQIERDLAAYAEAHLSLSTNDLTYQCEQLIRNYDPCISCATHFLKLNVERDSSDTT